MSHEKKTKTHDSGKELKLEDALKKLSEIVKKLEESDCELEESLKLFEDGVELTRHCHGKLNEAEKKIEILTRVSADSFETKNFDNE